MIRRNIDELRGDEILARALMTSDYQVILPKGAKIKVAYIDKLRELGIEEVYIASTTPEQEEQQILTILKNDIQESTRQKVQDILERHTYKNNEELSELSNTADNIITNILEEEKITEQVFDVKKRSADIYEHSLSICATAILTALKMGLDHKVVHDIGVACLLHDIGLRYIPFNVAGCNIEELSANEQAEYKKHPILGYTALRREDWLSEDCKNMILFHHEALDGTGFPMRNRDLSVACRIINVCEAFDEMICGIGQKPMKVYEAIEYLKAFKKIKFDDRIVDVFLGFTAVYPVGTHVVTNEGERGVVIGQNKGFHDRPILRIERNAAGEAVTNEVIKDLVKVQNVFIEKALD